MAKGQAKSNREAKKPKQDKKLVTPAAAASWAAPKTGAANTPTKKK
jgi:hypothetical protein